MIRILSFLILCTPLFASDPYNTLRWNRANYEAANGKIDTGPWYEWWYYKVVVPDTKEAFYFCYGTVNPWDKDKTQAPSSSFVNFGSFSDKTMLELSASPKDFQASYETTDIRILNNTATDKKLSGHLILPNGEAKWELNVTPEWSFNAMGWAMGMEGLSNIYWYPAQASARMTGTIAWNGKQIRLSEAPAYQDRNWGRSFSEWWAWIVSNQFKNSPGTVLAAGGGKPKISGGLSPEGVNIGLKHKGKEYTFRKNDFDTIKFNIHFGVWEVSAENRRGEKIEISAHAPKEEFLPLKFHTPEGKTYWDFEALKGNIQVRLYQRSALGSSWKQIADLETDEGGIEYGSFNPEPLDELYDSTVTLYQ